MSGRDKIMIKAAEKFHEEFKERFLNRRFAVSNRQMKFYPLPGNSFVPEFLTGGTADPLLLTFSSKSNSFLIKLLTKNYYKEN